MRLEFKDHKTSLNFFRKPTPINLSLISSELIDFKKVMHPNKNPPEAKSFSSDINLIEEGISRSVLIKMNEPLRHNEYTFYQSSFLEGEIQDISVFAVVKNYGRLFPYISSIIMCIGILFHLLLRIPKNKRV